MLRMLNLSIMLMVPPAGDLVWIACSVVLLPLCQDFRATCIFYLFLCICLRRVESPSRDSTLVELVNLSIRTAFGFRVEEDDWDQHEGCCSRKEEANLGTPSRVLVR